MHAFQWFEGVDVWHVAGWTMLHYLWLGALVGLAAGVCRMVLRRASANVRYVAALACLAVLAALPVVIAARVGAKPQAIRLAVSSAVDTSAEIAPTAPGSAGGLTGSARPNDPMDTVPVIEAAPIAVPNTIPNPRQSRGLTDVFALVAGYLPWLWIIGAPLTFLLLATGVVGAERLRRTSRVIEDGPISAACARLVESLRISRRVTVAVCERIAAPVLVGIVRPIILLPPAALMGWSPDEIEMVLLHELAHVRRWDNLVNLAQRFIESLLFFQPAVWLVSGWVRREREACCDVVVVGRTNRPHAYAELLVEFAALVSNPSEPGRPRPRVGGFTRGRGRPGSLVSSAMAAGPLRGRIRRILGIEDDPMLVSGKSLGVVMSGLLLAATLVVLNLPTRGHAEESTTGDTESTELKDNSERAESQRSSTDQWPAGAVFPSPKEGEISRLAWQKLGLKLVPATDAELAAADVGGGLKVIGGKSVPKGLQGIRILVRVNQSHVHDFDELLEAISLLESNPRSPIPCQLATDSRLHSMVQFLVEYPAGPANADRPRETIPSVKDKFPSLEDQKLADLAWKRMGLELEPIGAENLQRVKALGYDGGLRVMSAASLGGGRGGQSIENGDILVGLHVWPTTSLEEVAAVLNRGDLAELNPLKFYAIRAVPVTADGTRVDGGGFGVKTELKDTVYTGRISVSVNGSSSQSPLSSLRAARSAPRAASAYEPIPVAPLTESDRAKLLQLGPLRVQFFYSPNSEPCRRAEEEIAQYKTAFPGIVEVERINVEEQPALAADQHIGVVPTLILLQGKVNIAQRSGTFTVSELEEEIAKIARRPLPREQRQPILRYDGKTFDEWRTAWQTELSLEKRLEVVKALAAFGASGQGKEAAETILDVAGQLDWTFIDKQPAGRLKQACVDAFTSGRTTEGYRIPSEVWWPLVIPIYENSADKMTIVSYLAYQLPAGEKNLIPKLLELSNRDEATRNLALTGLKAVDPSLEDDRVVERFRQSLKETNKSPAELRGAINNLLCAPKNFGGGQISQLRMVPEFQPLLFHPDLEVRQTARFAITKAQPKDAEALVKYLVNIINSPAIGREREEAIRALAALGQGAVPAESKLKAIARDPNDAARISAAAALLTLWPDVADWQEEERLNKLFGPGAIEQTESDEVLRKLKAEQVEVFGVYTQSLGGGGGFF